jgi:WD40 repeat protein
LKVLDLETSQPVLEHREPREIFAAAFSPDGRWLAFGLWDGQVKLADARTGKESGTVGKHDRAIAMGGIAFGSDGLRLASVSRDGTVKVWDLTSVLSVAGRPASPKPESGSRRDPPTLGTEKENFSRLLRSQTTGIRFWSVGFSPDGSRLITGSKDGQLTLWDAESGQLIRQVPVATNGEFLSAAFSPDGRRVVSANEDCTVRVLDATTWEPIHTFRGHLGPIRCLAISPDGKFLATGSTDKTVKIWDLTQRRERSGNAFAPTGAFSQQD